MMPPASAPGAFHFPKADDAGLHRPLDIAPSATGLAFDHRLDARADRPANGTRAIWLVSWNVHAQSINGNFPLDHRQIERDWFVAMAADRVALFFKKVSKTDGCWLWTGWVQPNGYGQFWDGSKIVGAHVFSHRQFIGPVPEGYDVEHLCRNRKCVRPDHLEAVTRRENLFRGETIPARKAAQTHCKNGHPFTDSNTYRNKNGTRACRICRAALNRQWVQANRVRRRELDRKSYRNRTIS